MYSEYFDIAHRNLRDTIKHRILNIDGGKILETKDFLLFTIGVPSNDSHLNGCLSFNDEAYDSTFIEAMRFFKDLGFGFSFWIREGMDNKLENLLKEKDYEPKRNAGSSVMVTKARIEDASLPPGNELKEVKSLDYQQDLKNVIKEAFEKDDKIVDLMFSSKENLFSEKVKSFLVFNDHGKAVAAALTSITQDSAGIYYVGTLKEERSKGLGKAITKASTNIGFDQGKNIVILQASPLGEYVYEKLLYEKVGVYMSYGAEIT